MRKDTEHILKRHTFARFFWCITTVWWMRRAMLLKLSDQVERCYQRASECRAKAADAFNKAARQEYLDMEHRWFTLARSYELSNRVVNYTNGLEHRLNEVRPPELPAIPRVRCPECANRMRLNYIEPCSDERGAADTSVFICTCGLTYQMTTDRRT